MDTREYRETLHEDMALAAQAIFQQKLANFWNTQPKF